MPKKKEQELPGAEERSEKAHQDLPPKNIEPTGDIQGHQRGPAGQFTDKGAPGLQKR